MSVITPALISAAKGSEAAFNELLDALAGNIAAAARREATTAYELDDYMQVGRVIVWERLREFEGESGAQLVTYMTRWLTRGIARYRRGSRMPGYSERSTLRWLSALGKAGGDPERAVELATDPGVMGRRETLSRELAISMRDATISPPVSLDIPGVVEMAGAAPEPTGPGSHRVETARRVRHILSLMSDRQATVLRADFGIDPTPYATDTTDAELAADMGIAVGTVGATRSQAKARFRTLWVQTYGPVL